MQVDNRGIEPKVGDTVAYNFSGEINVGKIVEINKKIVTNWQGKQVETAKFKIEYAPNKYSIVTRVKNLLVIFED